MPHDSITPTFASIRLFIHNDRWAGVPFIIKAGKALDDRTALVRPRTRVQHVPHVLPRAHERGPAHAHMGHVRRRARVPLPVRLAARHTVAAPTAPRLPRARRRSAFSSSRPRPPCLAAWSTCGMSSSYASSQVWCGPAALREAPTLPARECVWIVDVS